MGAKGGCQWEYPNVDQPDAKVSMESEIPESVDPITQRVFSVDLHLHMAGRPTPTHIIRY